MAGRGPAPKPQAQRRNGHAPQRGEWVDLPPLERPVLPVADEGWPENVKRLWRVWREEDPVSAQLSSGERAWLWETAAEWNELQKNEQRLRLDGLGLTTKGKRDLRWRVVEAPVEDVAGGSRSNVRRLRVVAND